MPNKRFVGRGGFALARDRTRLLAYAYDYAARRPELLALEKVYEAPTIWFLPSYTRQCPRR